MVSSEQPLRAGLDRYVQVFDAANRENIAQKLGLAQRADDDVALMHKLFGLIQAAEVDMTLFFRAPSGVNPDVPSLALCAHAFYDDSTLW